MFTILICLFIACLIPYITKLPLMIAMNKQPGGYDNHHPRSQQATLTGFGARALSGHQNSFESLLIFSIACLTALVTHHTNHIIQILAIFYIVARIVYHIIYLYNLATLRSCIWALSLIASLSIIWLCIPW